MNLEGRGEKNLCLAQHEKAVSAVSYPFAFKGLLFFAFKCQRLPVSGYHLTLQEEAECLGILGRMRTGHRVLIIIRALLLHTNFNNQHSLL